MLVYGDLEKIVRISECFSLLINGDISVMELILRTFFHFLGVTANPCMMKRQGLVIFSGGQPRDSGLDSVPMDLCMWELCFSLVSPLWELCYSLASCQGMRLEKAMYF